MPADLERALIVPVLTNRPLSVNRVHRGHEAFMQKNVPKSTPSWISTVKTSRAKGAHVFVPIDDHTQVQDAAAATRAIAARAERLDGAIATTAFMKEDRAASLHRLDACRRCDRSLGIQTRSGHDTTPAFIAKSLLGGVEALSPVGCGLPRGSSDRLCWRGVGVSLF